MPYRKIITIISIISAMIIFFCRCFQPDSNTGKDPRGPQFAGAQTCINCHKDIYTSYVHSNHYKTSAAANNDSLQKLVAYGKDKFYFNDSSYVHMGKEGDSWVQSYFVAGRKVDSGRFDIAFGSGEKAQTYGYWKEDKLCELPLTFFRGMKEWANSPGFPANAARFSRVIDSRCFECHASFVTREFVKTGSLSVSEKLDRSTIMYGVDCERCHGPALEHVKFQQENPSVKTARYITSIKSLSRQQQLDICAVCHSGNDRSTQRSLFAFQPGDTLSHFYYPDFESDRREPDVHGKQLQLLQLSRCFANSDMTCNTCHSTHTSNANDPTVFVSKCMNCHQQSKHAVDNWHQYQQIKNIRDTAIQSCIDCHMPMQASKVIYFNTGALLKNIPYFLRTHKIAVYK